MLTKLTRLVLSGNPELPSDELDLGIEWHRLQALHTTVGIAKHMACLKCIVALCCQRQAAPVGTLLP